MCLCLCATCGDGEGVASFRLGVSPRQSLLVQSTHTEALKVFFFRISSTLAEDISYLRQFSVRRRPHISHCGGGGVGVRAGGGGDGLFSSSSSDSYSDSYSDSGLGAGGGVGGGRGIAVLSSYLFPAPILCVRRLNVSKMFLNLHL